MLSFEEIEDCFPEGAESDMPRSGKTLVSAQWLHDFAHAVAEKEREACAKLADEYAKQLRELSPHDRGTADEAAEDIGREIRAL